MFVDHPRRVSWQEPTVHYPGVSFSLTSSHERGEEFDYGRYTIHYEADGRDWRGETISAECSFELQVGRK